MATSPWGFLGGLWQLFCQETGTQSTVCAYVIWYFIWRDGSPSVSPRILILGARAAQQQHQRNCTISNWAGTRIWLSVRGGLLVNYTCFEELIKFQVKRGSFYHLLGVLITSPWSSKKVLEIANMWQRSRILLHRCDKPTCADELGWRAKRPDLIFKYIYTEPGTESEEDSSHDWHWGRLSELDLTVQASQGCAEQGGKSTMPNQETFVLCLHHPNTPIPI